MVELVQSMPKSVPQCSARYGVHRCAYPEGHDPIRTSWLVEPVSHANPLAGAVCGILCGASHPDYPTEHYCTYPKGHGPITDIEQDIHGMDHGDPARGAYWGVIRPDDLARRHAEERAQADAKVWIEDVVEARAQHEALLEAIEELAFGRGHRVKDWPEDEREAFRGASDITRSWAAVQRLRAEKILRLARGAAQ